MLDLKVNKEKIARDEGIVYVVEIDMPDEENTKVVKIGLTTKAKPEERWMQFALSIYKTWRRFAAMYPKRFKRTDRINHKEKELLNYFNEYQYNYKKRVDGCTEMFTVPLDIVVEAYDKVIAGEELYDTEERCPYCGKKKKFKINDVYQCAHQCEERLDENKDR